MPDPLPCQRPEEWHDYLAWEDAWRSRLMDLAAQLSGGDARSFQCLASIQLAAYLAAYES